MNRTAFAKPILQQKHQNVILKKNKLTQNVAVGSTPLTSYVKRWA